MSNKISVFPRNIKVS